MRCLFLGASIVAALLLASCNRSSSSALHVDAAIESELSHIAAIDNHAHPVRAVSPGEEDHDYDALPADAIQDLSLPTPFRNASPYFPEAWRSLFQYGYSDIKPEHLAALEQSKNQMRVAKGDLYPTWVLNRMNTEIMLANRVSMGRGLPNDRFKWVPFVDPFLFPLNNDATEAKDPEHRAFMRSEESLLRRFLADEHRTALPSSFDDYLTFVSHTLETWHSNGAVALKFELAYLRDLQISNAGRESADRVYSIYSQSSEPTGEEYKILQDYLFRYISQQAGRLHMAVHIHCSIGAGSYFRIANANPLALESVFNDPALRRTKFVMLHGGWPFAREAAALILKPNVYLDYSALAYLTYPVEASRALRLYLESAPEKVLYASDASPFAKDVGWEETGWLGSHYGRLALGLALTGMQNDGEITFDRAKELAHMVLRENARQLYGL